MKKILILLFSIILLPISVNAMEYTDTFKIGDRVEVHIINDQEKMEFFVIRPSGSGEQYVWLFPRVNIENFENYRDSVTVYDQTLPGDHDATTVLEDAKIYNILINGTENWRIEEPPRLLNASDLTALGINKNPSSGKYEIMGDRFFIAPLKIIGFSDDPSLYNYWTQIADTTKAKAAVYAVTYNESYNNDTLTPVATLESYDISSITENYEFIVKPIVKVDKKYIDCLVGGTPPVNNAPTSEVTIPFEALAIMVISILAYILIRKKDIFNKI